MKNLKQINFRCDAEEYKTFCRVCRIQGFKPSHALRFYVHYLGSQEGELTVTMCKKEGDTHEHNKEIT